MEEERKLLVGIDLGEDITQINYFDFATFEPVSVGRNFDGGRHYEIPTALALEPVSGEWFWADEKDLPEEKIIYFRHLLADIKRYDILKMNHYTIESYQVLKRFIIKILSILKEYEPNQTIRKLVITLAHREKKITEYLVKICGEIGIPRGGLVVQNHQQSYMYYAISQPKELWLSNVGLFELENSRLTYSQINIDRKTEPYIIGVTQKDLPEGIDWEELAEENPQQAAYAFLNAANTVLYKQLVMTIYVTGSGFEQPWATEALKELCSGRRVFRGQNLYTKGACYAARELSGEGKLQNCLFLDEEMIAANISIRLYQDAAIRDVLLVKAGTMWSDVDSSIAIIPDDEEEIQLTMQNVLKHEIRTHMLSLSGFAGRENKMTRFILRIRFADRNTCIVTLKDDGFGEFCPSSNRVWERYIKLEEDKWAN